MVIIIGAGPIGLACGIELRKRNIPFLIIEKGCLVNSIFHYPTNMTFFSTSDRLEMGGVPFISHGTKATRREALEYYRRVKEAYDMPVHVYEHVEDVKGEDGDFTVITDKDSYKAEKVIIATGFYGLPHKMNVPGEDLPKVKHYFDEPHPYVDQDVLVVGGGNSAVDVALETYRCGANVTMVVREPELKPGVKYWVRPDIENRIREGSIRCWFNSTVKEITEKQVSINTPEGEKQLPNDFVLAMTGYEPSFDFLKTMKLEFQNDEAHTPVYDEETMETSRPGVYIAGVVCGGLNTSRWFIENSIVHAEIIARDLERKSAGRRESATVKD
jgi:thioredoxin reductase (NADPH)